MNNLDRAETLKIVKTEVGNTLKTLREKAGLNIDQVAQTLTVRNLERIKRIESGEESIHGNDLEHLGIIYGLGWIELNVLLHEAVESAKLKAKA